MTHPQLQRIRKAVDGVRRDLAPDRRLVIFEMTTEVVDGRARVSGTTSSATAARLLADRIRELPLDCEVDVSVLTAHEHALVISPVAPVHASASVRSTQVSQAILGAPLRVFREDGRWLQCRFGDGYLGWVHEGYVARVGPEEAEAWSASLSLISLGAEASAGGHTILPLPWGAKVHEPAPHRARLPDGRVVEVSGELIPLSELEDRFPHEAEAVPETARRWIGSPYLWGGRTRGGVDCSGFVQNLFGLHGIALPRDSDQQARVGTPVDPGERFEGLLPGDLLFFGPPGRKITHVALSEGGGRIVHAFLGRGGVCRSDLNSPTDREEHLPRWFRSARRVIG